MAALDNAVMTLTSRSPCQWLPQWLQPVAQGRQAGFTAERASAAHGSPRKLSRGALKCLLAGGVASALAACSPALDWRDVRPAGTAVLLMMPCKPQAQERRVMLAGLPTRLTLHVCTADEMTWGLAFADVAEPARVAKVLQSLAHTAGANISATTSQVLPLTVRGATPNTSSQRLAYQGRLPDGRAVQMQVAVFAYGLRAFQATVLGGELSAEAAQNFMASIRFAD